MGKYYVQEPLRHDGADYAVGAGIDLEAKVADGLIGMGVLLDHAAYKAKVKAEADAAAAAAEGEKG